jgi:hypothetical protein
MPGEPKNKAVLMGHQEGDALGPRKRSAQEELAEFQLLKEKLSVRNDTTLTAEARTILGAMSEVEVLTLDIAQKLSTDPLYTQSSADYQELVRFTGEESYLGIARVLADQIYEVKRGQYLFSKFDGGASIANLRAKRTGGGLFGAIGAIASALGGGGGGKAPE